MKYIISILLLVIVMAFRVTNSGNSIKLTYRDTVPSVVPQLFGGKYYKFNGYVLTDSFIMNAPGDTNNIPYYPSLKFKASDNRWYGWDRSRWNRFLFSLDTLTLLATQYDLTLVNNGLTRNVDTTQLGGSLVKNTIINTGSSFHLQATGSLALGSATAVLMAENTGTGNGIYSTATTGSGIKGASTSGNAIFGIATSGVGGQFNSTSGFAAIQGYNSGGMGANLTTEPSSTNTTATILNLNRGTTGTAANNIAGSIDFRVTTNTTPYQLTNQIVTKLTNATNGSYASQMEFWGANNATVTRKAALAATGQWTWDGYPALTAQIDTTTYKPVAIDGSGNIVKMTGWAGSGVGGTVTQVNTGYGLSGGPITSTGTVRIDTAATDKRYEKTYNITDARFAGGAVADGKENSTASMTSGSATLTCTTCGFTSGDVGKWIRVYRAAASAKDMVTTITGFTNSTTVTLNTTAGSSVSADTVIYGTDNVPAIQAALDYANAQGGSAKVIIPPPGFGRFYVLGGALNHSGSDCNCQINFPVADIGDTSFNNRKNIILDGVVGPNYTPSALFSDTATPKMNTTLVSIIHGSGIRPSVFAAKANTFLYANYINYNLITVKNLSLLVERNRAGGGPDIGGFNFYNASSSPMENVVVSWNGPIHGTTQPTNEVAGVIAGQLSSEIYTTLKNVSVFGFKYGIVTTESVSMDHVIAHACVNGITLINGHYPAVGGYVDAHWCKNSVYVPASTILGDIAPGLTYFNFQDLALEVFQGSGLGAPAWLDYTYIISDSSNFGRGHIYGYTLGHAEVGIDNNMFNKFGGDSIFCYQTGSAVDRNTHIYAGLTQYAGWQNGGLTNYWYNWSPLNDVSIMRLSPTSAGSQGLYLAPNSTGGSGGVPKSWINLFNTAFWTGVNSTSTNTELLQIAAAGTAGYNITSSQSGSGTLRDINIGNSTLTTQLTVGAAGSTSINTTNTDALVINGNNSARGSILINNSNAAGSASLYVKNNLGFNAYGGMLTGGASDAGSSLFGLSRPDRTFIIHDGANGAGMGVGTLINQPLVFGTNNVARISVAGTGITTFLDSVGIGTSSPVAGLHISLPSNSTTGAGTFARVTDSRTTGSYRIAGLFLETNTNSTQLLSTTGDGLAFEPFNSKRGYYIRNLTNNGGIFATTNNNGAERKSLTLIGDSVGLGFNHNFTGSAYGGGFGGYPVLIGASTSGNGVAVGWSAQASNVEAVAIGPQTIANAFATIAIGDGARAQADSTTGNQIVMGDAAFAYGNINYFIGGGAGIGHGKDYVMCLGCQGASTTYSLDVAPAKHTALLGWYDETSSHFSGGAGLYNDWYLGGPYRSTVAHDISLNMTSMIGGDVNGVNFSINGSRGTGAGTPGDIIFKTGVAVATDTVLQSQIARFTIKGNGDLIAGRMPIGSNSDSALIWNRSTGRIEYSKINTGAGGGITTLNTLTGSTQTFATGTSGTDFGISSSGTTHTFNIPSASSSNRGLVTTTSQEFAGDKQYDDNIGIGIANSATNAILIERNNNDGGATDQPFIRLRNSNASNPSGSAYNIAGLTIGAGNDAVLAQFGTSYGTGATAPWNQQGFMVTTRTDDPIIFWTGATSVEKVRIANTGASLQVTGNATVSGNATFGTTNAIVGTATNNNATAGNIGEEISSTTSTYTNYTTTATYQNIASITLTAGDWDLAAFFTYSSNSATITAAANAIFVISTTTASPSGATEGQNINYVPQAALLGTSKFSDAIPPFRVSLSGTTTYYLNTQATFTLGNPQFVGTIRARRMR